MTVQARAQTIIFTALLTLAFFIFTASWLEKTAFLSLTVALNTKYRDKIFLVTIFFGGIVLPALIWIAGLIYLLRPRRLRAGVFNGLNSATLCFLTVPLVWFSFDLLLDPVWDNILSALLIDPSAFELKFLPLSAVNTLPIIVSLGLFFIFANADNRQLLKEATKFAPVISILTLLILGLQISGLANHLPPAWQEQNRLSAAFVDPNAFAVSNFLLLNLLLLGDFRGKSLLIAVQFSAGFLSGSRTYLLLAGLFTLQSLRYRKQIFVCGLTLIVLFNLIAAFFPGLLSALPGNIERTLSVMDLSQLSTTMFSRSVFAELNIAMFKDFPFFGVGFDHFTRMMPTYVAELKPGLLNWTDNSNNYYLGILSEQGLIGLCLFIWMLSSYRLQRYAVPDLIFIAAVFLSLLTGPHLHFPSFAILSGILLSRLLISQSPAGRGSEAVAGSLQRLAMGTVLVVLIVLIEMNQRIVPRGLYLPEVIVDASNSKNSYQVFQWAEPNAQVVLLCNNQLADLRIPQPYTVLSARPVHFSRRCYHSFVIAGAAPFIPSKVDPLSSDGRELAAQLFRP